MRLNKLIINGFKSFCNKTEFIFPKNITGIVGPNGSGKSNIADAVRWVLGEQNPRLLRGGKMEDVIFNGTQKKKAMNFCEVSLVFDNDDKILHPDYLEIMVTRRVFRSGESEYEINNTPCRLKDVIEMFSDTGIGKEGYSIIGQGKIDDILSRKTEDRRAVFEEAAGINYFKLKKRESELKLQRAEENLQRINDIASEQERMLEPLKNQAENAKKYISLSQELKELSAALFIVDYDRLTAKYNTINKNLVNIEKDIYELKNRSEQLTEEIEQIQEDSISLDSNASKIAENVINSSRELSEIQNKSNKIQFDIEKNEENLSRIKNEIDDINTKRNILISNNNNKEDLLDELKLKLDNSTKSLTEFENSLNKELEHYTNIKSELESAKNQVISNMNILNQSESSRARYLAIKEQMQSRINELENSLSKISDANTVFKKKYDENKVKYEEQILEKNKIQEKLSEQENNLEKLILNIRNIKSQIDETNKEINIKSSRLKTIEDISNSYEGYAPAVKFAMQSAKKKNMQKVYGTLASLINVPKEYETAIDMVLGAALQNIVCEDEESAKILVEDLRKNSAGRATFLPINSIRPNFINSNELASINRNNYIDVASKLISFNPNIKNIIENLLGRTLIIRSIDDGIAIRKVNNKLRMVSLVGDVMHSGGSITGGSIKSNSTSFLSRKRIMSELKLEISEKNKILNEMQKEYDICINNRVRLEEAKKQSEIMIHEQDIKLTQLNEILKASYEDNQEHINEENDIKSNIESLNQSLIDIDSNIGTVSSQRDDIEEENKNLNNKIKILQSEYESHDNTYNSMQEEMLNMKLKHSDIEHELNQLIRDKDNKQKSLDEYNAKEHILQNNINFINLEKQRLEELKQKVLDQLDEAQKSLNNLEKNQKEIESQRSEQSKKIRSLQEEEKNVSKSYLKYLDKKHSLEIQKSNTESQKQSLADNIWTKFELTYASAEKYRPDIDFDVAIVNKKLAQINSDISELGTVNVNAVNEYADLQSRHSELVLQKEDLLKSINDLNKLIRIMLTNMEKQFVDSFSILKEYFSETFTKLFGGGVGELKLSDPSKALECGIEIIVQPPGKKKQILSLFSGGERALTAIALIFAMLKLRPSPFCIFDEIEAALDDANINYFADYLKSFSNNTQFIVVTHRKGTMERCDSLYGIAMAEKGISNVLSLDISNYN